MLCFVFFFVQPSGYEAKVNPKKVEEALQKVQEARDKMKRKIEKRLKEKAERGNIYIYSIYGIYRGA